MATELKITFCFWLVELLKKLSPNDFADTNADCKNMRSIKNVKKRRVIFTASDYHKNKYEESAFCNLRPADFWIPSLKSFIPKRRTHKLPAKFKIMEIIDIMPAFSYRTIAKQVLAIYRASIQMPSARLIFFPDSANINESIVTAKRMVRS